MSRVPRIVVAKKKSWTKCPLTSPIPPTPTISSYRVWLPQHWHDRSHRLPINTMRPRPHRRRLRPATDHPLLRPLPPTSRSPQATVRVLLPGMDRPARRQSSTSTFTSMCHHQSRNTSLPGEWTEINPRHSFINYSYPCLDHQETNSSAATTEALQDRVH